MGEVVRANVCEDTEGAAAGACWMAGAFWQQAIACDDNKQQAAVAIAVKVLLFAQEVQ